MPIVTLSNPETCSLPNLSTPIVSRPSKIQLKTVKADYETVKSMIAPLQFNCLREYKDYIFENNLTDIFPKNPQAFYSKNWVNTADFLSMSEERVHARNVARSLKAISVRRQNAETRKQQATQEPTVDAKVENPQTSVDAPDAVKTITQLIDLGVPVNLVESVFKSMDLSVSELKSCVIYLLNK